MQASSSLNSGGAIYVSIGLISILCTWDEEL